jgi:RsiW-degrading membrane proteinase PrsW (M82 family)
MNPYPRLLGMAALSFVSMYLLMYSMTNALSDVYNSLNQAYMAALMTAPMVVFELWLMSGMYRNRAMNAWLVVASVVVGGVAFLFIRQQTAIGDRQFLRSMIPHHSGAILMCTNAPLTDQRIRDLCRSIVESQREEIDRMRDLMADLDMR